MRGKRLRKISAVHPHVHLLCNKYWAMGYLMEESHINEDSCLLCGGQIHFCQHGVQSSWFYVPFSAQGAIPLTLCEFLLVRMIQNLKKKKKKKRNLQVMAILALFLMPSEVCTGKAAGDRCFTAMSGKNPCKCNTDAAPPVMSTNDSGTWQWSTVTALVRRQFHLQQFPFCPVKCKC